MWINEFKQVKKQVDKQYPESVLFRLLSYAAQLPLSRLLVSLFFIHFFLWISNNIWNQNWWIVRYAEISFEIFFLLLATLSFGGCWVWGVNKALKGYKEGKYGQIMVIYLLIGITLIWWGYVLFPMYKEFYLMPGKSGILK